MKHDCEMTKEMLLDLVFNELTGESEQRLLAELDDCQSCDEYYQSLRATLRVVDRATALVMPEESYWAGYEARLRARLAEPVRQNGWQKLTGWFTGFSLLPGVPVVAAVAVLVIVAVLSFWMIGHRKSGDEGVIARKDLKSTPSPLPSASPSASPRTVNPLPVPDEEKPKQQLVRPSPPRHPQVPSVVPKTGLDPAPVDDPPARVELAMQPARNLDPARHFEKAQLLLRAFRNARFDRKDAAFDLAGEKKRSRGLLYENILLRREAAASGNLPVEELLSRLEPLLLDIANLPDKPAPDDVRPIRERINKNEIVATLQIYSAGVTEMD